MLLQCICFINNFVRAKTVPCWNYLYTWAFYQGFSKGIISIVYLFFLLLLLNHAVSQSTLKFSGLKQPLFIISHESKGHLCYLASLS